MYDNILADAPVRKQIEEIMDKNFIVEAGAGSGKTTGLVTRMVRLISSGYAQVGEIVAITFTRKAAAELSERFQNKLEQALRNEADEDIRLYLSDALMNLDSCFIGTVHAFCGRLLRERPIEAGVDPGFEELDEAEDRRLKAQAWSRYIDYVKYTKPQQLNAIEELGVSPLDLEGCYSRIVDYPDVRIVYNQLDKPDFIAVMDELKVLVAKYSPYIPPFEPEKGYDSLQHAIKYTSRCLRYHDMSKTGVLVNILKRYDKRLKPILIRWLDKQKAKEAEDDFNLWKDTLMLPLLKGWREYCHGEIIAFIKPALSFYEEEKRKSSSLNFQDLLMITMKTLRDYPEVRSYFQDKIRCLLVDEFQDTDPIQAQIMCYLTGLDIHEKNWDKLCPRPGSLFIVGDPKQSIYRFRRADIDIYNRVRDILIANGGEMLALTTNFWSIHSIGEHLNKVHRRKFPEDFNSYQAAYAPLDTIRPTGAYKHGGIRVLRIMEKAQKKEETVFVDAAKIARTIEWAMEGGLELSRTGDEQKQGKLEKAQYNDFLILIRFKDSMEVYAKALENLKIPYTISGGGSFSKSREMKELYKLIEAINNPHNKIAVAALLRGHLFGISDDVLYRYKEAGGSFHPYAPVPASLSDQDCICFEDAYTRLQQYIKWKQMLPTAAALEKVLDDIGFIPMSLNQSKDLSSSAYLFQYLERVRAFKGTKLTEFRQAVDLLKDMLDSDVEEELDITAEQKNVVRLMNLHKAKGLEAPVVFLAHPQKVTTYRAEQHIKREEHLSEGYFSLNRTNGYQSECIAHPQDWDLHKEEEIIYLQHEENRLLYVAGTRAMNLLIVSSCGNDDKNPWFPILEGLDESYLLDLDTIQSPTIDNSVEVTTGGKTISNNNSKDEEKKVFELDDYWTFHKTNSFTALAMESDILASPTGLKDIEEIFSIKRGSGGGTVLGLALHRIFEEIVKETSGIDEIISFAMLDYGIEEEKRQELLKAVEDFMASTLWQRIQVAQTVMVETPFTLKIEKHHPLYTQVKGTADVPVILSGVIDLIFLEYDQWVIVDYKSDRVQDEANLEKLAMAYAPQLEIYRQVWEEITKQPVKEGIIYFVEYRRECSV